MQLTISKRFILITSFLFALLLNLNACSTSETSPKDSAVSSINKKLILPKQQQDFFNTLNSMCGQEFVGQSTFPTDPDDSFYGKTLVASIDTCSENEIRIPFVVGENRSRTWIIRKTNQGLELKHQHLHDDGTPDEVTNYGGTSNPLKSSSLSQAFPADKFTQGLIPAASTNVWTMTLSADGNEFTYYLERHNQPRFKAVLNRDNTSL